MPRTLRSRVADVLGPGVVPSRASRWVNAALVLLILISIGSLVVESMPGLSSATRRVLWLIEATTVFLFTIEYAFRLWACVERPKFASSVTGRARFAATPMAIIDLLAILPFYLPLLGVDLRVLRILRLMRIARVLKLGRYSEALTLFWKVLVQKREELIAMAVFVAVLALLSATALYYAERDAQPEAFGSIPAALWWAVVTLTSVGYGDAVPITLAGRIAAMVIAVIGIGLVALPAGVLGAAFIEELQNRRSPAPAPTPNSTPDPSPTRCPYCDKPLT